MAVHVKAVYEVKGSEEQEGKDGKGSTGALPFVCDCRTAAVAAAGRLQGCRGDARISRDDVLHHARRSLTQSRPDNKDDWQDDAVRAVADRPPLRPAASLCRLVSTVTQILSLWWRDNKADAFPLCFNCNAHVTRIRMGYSFNYVSLDTHFGVEV